MPHTARCLSCGASLSETAVLALAPVCAHCGAVMTSVGGSLGLTSAYGVSDATITRRRIQADLAVFTEYHDKYRGMLEACREQLTWNAERYAERPTSLELLPLQHALSLRQRLMNSFFAKYDLVPTAVVLLLVLPVDYCAYHIYTLPRTNSWGTWNPLHRFLVQAMLLVVALWVAGILLVSLYDHARVNAANGSRPQENDRRQKAYVTALAEALRTAERKKAAQDHRLRQQIAELEGLTNTVEQKAGELRRLLATHP